MEQFNELCIHPFIIEKVKLTIPALRRRHDLKIIIHSLILNSESDLGFSGKEVIAYCDMIRNGTENVSYEDIRKLLDYLHSAITEKRPYLRLMHVPVIMHLAQQAMAKKMAPELFGTKLDNFFMSKNEEYKEASMQGSSKKANIQTRVRTMSSILS